MLQITYVQNTGGAFGIGEGSLWQVLIVNGIIIGIVLRFLIMQFEKIDNITRIILCFVLAGGISNLGDRLFRGFVIDYLDISSLFPFPVFNFADIYVVLGWTMLILVTIRYTVKDVKTVKVKPQ